MSVVKYIQSHLQKVQITFNLTDGIISGTDITAALGEDVYYLPLWWQAKEPVSQQIAQQSSLPYNYGADWPDPPFRFGVEAISHSSQTGKFPVFVDQDLLINSAMNLELIRLFAAILFDNLPTTEGLEFTMIAAVFRPAGAFDEGYK